jgi:hypothetical protein
MSWSENKNSFYLLIIVVLVIVLLLQKSCGGGGTVTIHNDTIKTSDTVYHTVLVDVPKYIPKWNTKKEYIHDTTKLIDTAFVIGDYYSTYFYKDSLIIKDTMSFYINDSICKNKISSRKINYKFTYPTITNTNTVIKNKNEFYVGLGLVGSKTGINFFGPELLLRTKKKNVYGVGVGIDGNFTPNLSLRTYWKIGKK